MKIASLAFALFVTATAFAQPVTVGTPAISTKGATASDVKSYPTRINFSVWGLDNSGNFVYRPMSEFVQTGGTYANPAWFVSLEAAKIPDLETTGGNWWSLLGHTHAFNDLTGKPTTIGGYGITDFNALGDARYSLLAHTHAFNDLTSKPTTIVGYGITDFNATGDARYQQLNTLLTTFLGLSPTAGNIPYFNGGTSMSVQASTSVGRGLLASSSLGALRTYMEVVPGTHVQAQSTYLQQIHNLGAGAVSGNMLIFSGGNWSLTTISTPAWKDVLAVNAGSGGWRPTIETGDRLQWQASGGGSGFIRVTSTLSGNTSYDIVWPNESGTVVTSNTPTWGGQAGTALLLANGRNIQTNLASTSSATFTGGANITPGVTGILGTSNGGTNNAFFAISGPASTIKTYTFPNANATMLYSGGPGFTPSSITLTNGTGLPVGGISATGTPSSSTFLRGDGQWVTAGSPSTVVREYHATAFRPNDTDAPTPGGGEVGSIALDWLAFPASVNRYADIMVTPPDGYAGGTITVQFQWRSASGSSDVRWFARAGFLGDGTTISTSLLSTATNIDDTRTGGTLLVSSATAAITPGGTWASGGSMLLRVGRDGSLSGLAVDAHLVSVRVTFNM